MAEVVAALGVVASVAQLADYGFKLSMKLYTFSEAVYSADASIKSISSDVSLTSTVLKELCGIIKSDESHVVSNNALIATSQTVKDCLQIFEELDQALDKSVGEGGIRKRDKIKWPFREKKMELLRGNLDRLKANLTLMLQVLSYARDVNGQKEKESNLVYQQHLIEQLARSEKAMRRRYERLKREMEYQKIEHYQPTGSLSINAVGVIRSRDIGLNATALPGVTEISHNKSPLPADGGLHSTLNPRILIAELLLCFQLLNELLDDQLKLENGDKGSSPTSSSLEQLNFLIERMRAENQIQYHNAPPNEKSEAAKNIQLRIMDMLNGQKPRHLHQESYPAGEDYPLAPYSPASPAYSPTSPVSETTTKFHMPGNSKTAYDPYDPYVTVGGNPTTHLSDTQRQQQINDTISIMREQINKVSQRGERLDSLQEKTDNPAQSTYKFRQGSSRLRQPFLLSPLVKAIQAAQELSSSVYKSSSTLFTNQEGYESEDGISIPQDTETVIKDFLRSPEPKVPPENSQQILASRFASGNIGSDTKIESISAHSDVRQSFVTEDQANQKTPEENESDEEPDEEQSSLTSTTKRRRARDRRNQFLDVEAEVDEDEDEDEDDEDSGVLEELLSKWTNLPRKTEMVAMEREGIGS